MGFWGMRAACPRPPAVGFSFRLGARRSIRSKMRSAAACLRHGLGSEATASGSARERRRHVIRDRCRRIPRAQGQTWLDGQGPGPAAHWRQLGAAQKLAVQAPPLAICARHVLGFPARHQSPLGQSASEAHGAAQRSFPSQSDPGGQVEKHVPLMQRRQFPGPPQTSQVPVSGLQVSQRWRRSHGAGRHASPHCAVSSSTVRFS